MGLYLHGQGEEIVIVDVFGGVVFEVVVEDDVVPGNEGAQTQDNHHGK